jgi:hypothetical protein
VLPEQLGKSGVQVAMDTEHVPVIDVNTTKVLLEEHTTQRQSPRMVVVPTLCVPLVSTDAILENVMVVLVVHPM